MKTDAFVKLWVRDLGYIGLGRADTSRLDKMLANYRFVALGRGNSYRPLFLGLVIGGRLDCN